MEKIKDNGVPCTILDNLHTIMYMPIELGENIETFMTCGRNKVIESFIQHYLVIHGFDIFGPIISNVVHELTFNPLLVFHHVMHIPKYPLFELR
jgi:hypothetical protein